jgi:hypothetical protein
MSIASVQHCESGHVSYATLKKKIFNGNTVICKIVIIYKKSTGGTSTNVLTIHKTMHLIFSSEWAA